MCHFLVHLPRTPEGRNTWPSSRLDLLYDDLIPNYGRIVRFTVLTAPNSIAEEPRAKGQQFRTVSVAGKKGRLPHYAATGDRAAELNIAALSTGLHNPCINTLSWEMDCVNGRSCVTVKI